MSNAQLERELPADLPPSWQSLGCDFAETVARAQVTLDILEVGMVEQVEELKTHLEIQPLVDVRVLVNRHVRLHEGRIAELVELLIAFPHAGWCSELSGREHTSGVGTAGRSLLVTGNIWKIERVSVGVVIATVPEIGTREHGKGIAGLVNAGTAQSPAASGASYKSLAGI